MIHRIIPLITMFGLFVFMIWYTAYRLHAHFKFIRFWVFQIIAIVVALGPFAAVWFTGKYSNSFAGFINIISGYAFLFLIYLFFLLIIAHLIQLKFKLPLVWSGAAALAIAFIVVFIGAVIASFFVVREIEIKIPKLEKELVIMQISDVHLGHHRGSDYLEAIVKETNSRNPDLVLITGDLLDAESSLRSSLVNPLSGFKAPVYFVEGNHEIYAGIERAIKLIEEQGVRVLRNEVIETHGIQLIGLDYMKVDEDKDANSVKSVLKKIHLDRDIPSVLMIHSPLGAQYADDAGIDLMLSGHTHGGQFFPLLLLGKMTFPLNSGLYQLGNTKLFVSNGAGTSFMIRARLGTFNEINLFRLEPDN